MNTRSVLLGLAAVALAAGGIACALWLGTVLTWQFGTTSGAGTSYLTIGGSLIALVQSAMMLWAFVAFADMDKQVSGTVNRLWPPLVLDEACLFGVLLFLSISGIDLLKHDLISRWTVLREPEARALVTALYLGMIGARGWLFVTMLSGRQTRLGQVLAAYAVISVVPVVAMIVVVWR